MIIFDLSCLANDEHRRHFIDYEKRIPPSNWEIYISMRRRSRGEEPKLWKPDHKSYNEACGEDKAVYPVIETFKRLGDENEVHLWSIRPTLVTHKTELWLWDHAGCGFDSTLTYPQILKLRPIDDTSPQEELFERWLDQYMFQDKCNQPTLKDAVPVKTVEFVFSAHKPTIQMFRKRGIFVFDCGQEKE